MILMATRRGVQPVIGGAAPDDRAELRAATEALAGALLALARLGGRSVPPGGAAAEAAGIWADDDYLYIEARLPDGSRAHIDASACGRALMVRIARLDDDRSDG